MGAAHGLARYASICQSSGLVPIIEPEILLDGEHSMEENAQTFEETWSAVFKACADFGVQLEAALLKPSMVTPGAQSGAKAEPAVIAASTLAALKRVVPPALPGIMFLSGGQSELEATLNLNAMNQSPNPWHVSFSYARARTRTRWLRRQSLSSVPWPTPRRSSASTILPPQTRTQAQQRACTSRITSTEQGPSVALQRWRLARPTGEFCRRRLHPGWAMLTAQWYIGSG